MTAIESKIGVPFLGKYGTPIPFPWWKTTRAIHLLSALMKKNTLKNVKTG